MGFEFDPFAGLKTEDLKNEIDSLRQQLLNREATYHDEMKRLNQARGNLEKMEEKANFVVVQLEQMTALTTPPPKSEGELASDALDRYFTDPVYLAAMGLSAGGGAVLVMSMMGPPVLKLIGKAPKLGRAATLAKSTKFLKVAKFAKVTVVLGAALAIVELLVGMVSAQEINKQLRADKAALNKNIRDADALIDELRTTRKDAEKTVRELLAEADLGQLPHAEAMEAYVRMMNEAIAGLSRQNANARMVRKMAIKGMAPEDIADFTGVAADVVASIATRATVELDLVKGSSPVEISRQRKLSPDQVAEIDRVVRARGDAIAGEDVATISKVMEIPASVVREEAETTLPLLAVHWGAVEDDGDLQKIALASVVPVGALERLRVELRAKSALAAGKGPADVSSDFQRDLEDIARWATDLADARGDVAILRRDGDTSAPTELAARLRLPVALTA